MENRHKVHNLIILDESGSMHSIKPSIIQGFNEIVQTMKGLEKQYPEQDHYITLVSFNGLGQKTHLFCQPVKEIGLIDDNKYLPDASTPLLDAMGFSFIKLKNELENSTDYHVLVTILTDGEENASKEFSGASIKKLVEELSMKNWTFTYIGTDHDVDKFAISVSISNTMTFEKNPEDIKNMFVKEQSARMMYNEKIRKKEDASKGFYTEENDKS
jgi:Mg-chelatase subunit ChlD